MEQKQFERGGKQAVLYRSEAADRPLIVLNHYEPDAAPVLEALRWLNAPDCNLLVVGKLRWEHDMSPWACPGISKHDAPFTGGAEAYLELLLRELLPEAAGMIRGTPLFTGIAGYSLAGLFALYALYRCEAFDRAASISGSLWFPGFREYALTQPLRKRPSGLYLSLGDREARTKNSVLSSVRENTEALVAHYQSLGLAPRWELNPGNHFQDAALRCARGIRAILE